MILPASSLDGHALDFGALDACWSTGCAVIPPDTQLPAQKESTVITVQFEGAADLKALERRVAQLAAMAARLARPVQAWSTVGEAGPEVLALAPQPNTTPRGLTVSGLDGERLGRLAWVPGA